MSKTLMKEDIKKAVLEYVLDERRTQAVLLDGEWGCGKTFFVNNYLIPELLENKNIRVLKISLYGISDVNMIQNLIYSQWLKAYIEKKINLPIPLASLTNILIRGLGKSIINKFADVVTINDEDIKKQLESFLESDINNKAVKKVIIFDDFERCHVNIIELMGFLNNLSENDGFKLILVANEKELNRLTNKSEEALKYIVALNSRINFDFIEGDKSYEKNNKVSITELKDIATQIFGDESVYERTREKLIGLTLPCSVFIRESFEDIINKYIKDEAIQKKVLENKNSIIEILEENNHRNLRTLVSACIAIEKIVSLIDDDVSIEKNILGGEIKTIILYSVYSAMHRSMGIPPFQWPINTRYSSVNDGIINWGDTRIYGYAFIDEYWETQYADKEVILKDLHERVQYLVSIKQSQKEEKEHKHLALYQLKDWYMLQDEEVKKLIVQMEKELEDHKYEPFEFRDIILILMDINNPNYGIKFISDNYEGVIYDSTKAFQFSNINVVDDELSQLPYVVWEKVDISKYVALMISYFDKEKEFTLTIEMIRLLSRDKDYAYNYRNFTIPLLSKIEENLLVKIYRDEKGQSLLDMSWDSELENILKEKSQGYINQGRFLSLFDYDGLIERISNANASEIHYFCNAIGRVYSFSNLGDVFFKDLDLIMKVIEFIDTQQRENEELSRTKAIAMFRLKDDFKKYYKKMESKSM